MFCFFFKGALKFMLINGFSDLGSMIHRTWIRAIASFHQSHQVGLEWCCRFPFDRNWSKNLRRTWKILHHCPLKVQVFFSHPTIRLRWNLCGKVHKPCKWCKSGWLFSVQNLRKWRQIEQKWTGPDAISSTRKSLPLIQSLFLFNSLYEVLTIIYFICNFKFHQKRLKVP